MEEVFKALAKQREEGDRYQYHLDDPVSPENLKALEDLLCLIPDNYRSFLLAHDGGFICNGHWAEYIWETGNTSLPESSSIRLLSSEEVYSGVKRSCTDSPEIVVSFIIALTPNDKCLILETEKESPVYAGYNDGEEWRRDLLYTNFKSFFLDYVENKGYIKGLC